MAVNADCLLGLMRLREGRRLSRASATEEGLTNLRLPVGQPTQRLARICWQQHITYRALIELRAMARSRPSLLLLGIGQRQGVPLHLSRQGIDEYKPIDLAIALVCEADLDRAAQMIARVAEEKPDALDYYVRQAQVVMRTALANAA